MRRPRFMPPVALATVCILAGGCRTRLWELTTPDDMPPPADFSFDATPLRDLAPPPDLVLPFVCRDIYLVDAQSEDLFGFDAMTATFHRVGTLACPTRGQMSPAPETMAIGRDGYAYVFYGDGELFKASIVDAKCQSTTFDPLQIDPSFPAAGDEFGSAFSADQPGGASETLFVALPGQGVLGRVDLKSLTVTKFGAISTGTELTGTAAAELWGLFIDAGAMTPKPTVIARIDKQSGALDHVIPIPQIVPQANVGYGFAFAFWGGGFWVFYYDSLTGGGDTTVYRVDRETGVVHTVLTGTGRHIVGAGVSSCAPLGLDR